MIPATAPVAVIGLGAMGLPMAARLAETLSTRGFDVSADRASAARTDGVQLGSTPADTARECDTVVLSLRTLAQAEEAVFGADGVVHALAPGAVVVLTSTVGIDGARAMGAALSEQGIHFLDLPVSGGPARARTGELLAFSGGSAAAAEAARPVVGQLATTVAVVGSNPGDGQAMKTVNQLLCGVHIAAAAEALALADALGLDPGNALSALEAGAAASFMLSNRGPRIVQALAGTEPEVLSRVDIFVKDMGIVSEAGLRHGIALPVAGAADHVYRLADAAGSGARDDATISQLLRKR